MHRYDANESDGARSDDAGPIKSHCGGDEPSHHIVPVHHGGFPLSARIPLWRIHPAEGGAKNTAMVGIVVLEDNIFISTPRALF
jgi:hypothetical protein